MDVEEELENRRIYADFLKFCEPVKASDPWSRFAAIPDFFRPPEDENAVHWALRETYSRKALRRSQVMTLDSQKKLVFNPRLCTRPDFVVPLRAASHDQPFDLLTGEGTVSGRLPVCGAAMDHLMGEGEQRHGLIFAAFSMFDVMVLRAIGAPAVLASGLERFTSRTLAEFRATFGTTATAAVTPPHLVLVGWTPSRMSRIRSGSVLDGVIRNLQDAGDCFGVRLKNVLLWQPTFKEIVRLARCLQIGRITDVADALSHSFHQSAKPLASGESDTDSQTILEKSRAAYRKALLDPDATRGRRRRRRREFQNAVDEVLIKPLYEQAMEEPDLQKRSRLLALAEANRELHYRSVRHSVKVELCEGELTDEMLVEARQMLSKLQAVYKLAKE